MERLISERKNDFENYLILKCRRAGENLMPHMLGDWCLTADKSGKFCNIIDEYSFVEITDTLVSIYEGEGFVFPEGNIFEKANLLGIV